MKLLIDQLRNEQQALQRQIFAVAAAVHSGRAANIQAEVHKLSVTLFGHLSFERVAALPELARYDEGKGWTERAARVRRFLRELETIEAALKDLLAPLQRVTTATEAVSAWARARDVIHAFMGEEASLLDAHAARPQDRRHMPRLACDCPVVFRGGPDTVAKLRDLSLGGMQLELDGELPSVGAFVDVRLLLPGAPAPVDVCAEVRWHSSGRAPNGPKGAGARFINLQPTAGLAIASWLAGASLRKGRVAPVL